MDQQHTDRRPSHATAAPRDPSIYYLHPLLAGALADWPALLDRVAGMGFSHVLLAPPFAAASVLLADDLDRPLPSLACDGDAAQALQAIDRACRAAGLSWMLDVVLDRVAPAGVVARAQPSLFAAAARHAVDPRLGPPVAQAQFGAQAEALAEWWGARLVGWSQAGACGFRLLGLDATPRAFLRRLKARTPTALWLGGTEGVSTAALAGLGGCGLDYATVALQDWDFGADWFWTRLQAVERVAPALASVEAPFGRRAAAAVADTALLGAALRRLAGTAAALGRGWMMPMGFEHGAMMPLDPRRSLPADLAGEADLDHAIATINQRHDARPGSVRPVAAPGLPCTAVVHGLKRPAALVLINPSLEAAQPVSPAQVAAALGCDSVADLVLQPGEVRTVDLSPMRPIRRGRQPRSTTAAGVVAKVGRIGIEKVAPQVEAGRFATKACAGDTIAVSADLICDGHDKLGAVLQWRPTDQPEWSERRMTPMGNDRWGASFAVPRIGRYLFRVQAWRDAFATYRDELAKKTAAGLDVRLEVMEGQALVEASSAGKPGLGATVTALASQDRETQIATLLGTELQAAMAEADTRPFSTTTTVYPVEVDRVAARFASWYEIFPRSMSDDVTRHGNFADVIRHLPRIRDMGFDVLYFPPISPIGHANRKGRNNTLTPTPDDPGSPYAIGNEHGGHDALHPELGTLEDFRRLRDAAAAHGLELAIDFAVQCSPDHPWLREHKEWFAWRPDGSMRYAENPPKKYEDIVNVDFYASGAVPDLWVALCDVVLFWAQQGVRVFRVDNPHTKPLPFWEWLIGEVRAAYPDAIFLAEAFTRPKVMNRLGKLGFSQSYTYFTWRNTKAELTEYLTELTTTDQRDFFRPNFFVNTPDINPPYLQTGGRPAHLIRAALAATLAGSWGVYCGFELCEATPIPGREDYLDSEKYQLRAWDWDRPGNIVAEITRLNRIRRANPALQTHLGVTFLPADNENVLFFEKATSDRGNVVLVAVSLDPFRAQSAAIELPFWEWRLPDQASLACDDLLRDVSFTLTSKWQRVSLTPDAPCTIWRVKPAV